MNGASASDGTPQGFAGRGARIGLLALAGGALAALAVATCKRRKTDRLPRPEAADAERAAGRVFAKSRAEIVYAWRGPSLLIVNNQGRAGDQELSGLFFREARYLRDLRLEIQGEDPFPCSLAELNANELEFSFVYPEKTGGGSDRGGESHGIRYRDFDLRLHYEVHAYGILASVWITNRWLERVAIDVGWLLSADFADMGEIYGERQQQAEIDVIAQPNGVQFCYRHPEIPMETYVTAEGGAAWSFANDRLSARILLERQATVQLCLRVRAVDLKDLLDEREAERRERHLGDWLQRITYLEAPGELPLAEATNRAVRDLGSMALLEGQQDEWLCPAAGLPVFPDLWGRDALTAAWQASIFDGGQMADSILTRLGRLQGKEVDPWRDEQPGRIIRAAQRGPLTRLGKTPFDRYYGDFASPFAFIFALGQLYAWSGDKRLLNRHWDAARRVIDWAREYGDRDGDGYLEYKTESPAGPTHQGWRDGENGVVDGNGRQVSPPIAPSEIQGYYFVAQQLMAVLSVARGELGNARALWTASKKLKQSFNRDFWIEEENCVALGLDADKRQLKAVTSNAGHCLTSGIVDKEKLPRLVHRLFQPDMFSGWGIRTLSTRNPSYNPVGYHLGSIWAVENATVLFGLRRFGFDREALQLARALYDLTRLWSGQRIPECVGGYGRSEYPHPGAFPQANVPQTWNLSVFPILVQSLLGLRGAGSLEVLALDPVLPEWLPELTVRNLRVGQATVSLRFWRDRRGDSYYDVLQKRGTLHILRQPPFDSLTVGIWDRLGALINN